MFTTVTVLSFQPDPPGLKSIDDFLDEINAFALPSDRLCCGEYCFQFGLNPWQHASFDDNIHHLDALLIALSNSCGGLVFLSTDEVTSHKKIQFSTFTAPGSLSTLSSREINHFAFPRNVWSVIAVKPSAETAFYELNGCDVEISIDIHGLLQYVTNSPDQPGIVEFPAYNAVYTKTEADIDPNSVSTEPSQQSPERPGDSVDMSEPPVELSTVRELNWDQNKGNWQNILRKPKGSIDDLLSLCDVLESQMPMQFTPDKDSLRYLFPSHTKFNDALHSLATKTPGFAIGSRSWLTLLPELGLLQRPPNHLCDILTVSKGEGLDLSKPNVCLWVVVSYSNEQIIRTQLKYMFMVGRGIKQRMANQSREVPSWSIRCLLHSTHDEDNFLIENTLQELGIQSTQDFLCSIFAERNTFDAVKRGIGRLILSQESCIKDCAGEQLSVKLTAEQAKTLLQIKGRRVSYVSSAPGTGKTLCGLTLYRDFGKEHSVYICPTEPLLQYLRYNGCNATLIRNDVELHGEINQGTFGNKTCVIIDESHHLRCSKKCLAELFWLVKKHNTSLFVFADNEFQSFDRENQQNIEQYIYELSREVLGYYPNAYTFTEMYRNTRKVVSFLQHAIEENDQDIACGNASDGEGIQAIYLEKLWDNCRENGLVQYLIPLLILPNSSTDGKYPITHVAVLLDSGHTTPDADTMTHILQTQLPQITVQRSDQFPRKGIIVDKIERFVGLDAHLCIFLLSGERSTNPNETIDNARYRVFLASRATQKAVFVVSKIDTEIIQCLKFDRFQVSKLIKVHHRGSCLVR